MSLPPCCYQRYNYKPFVMSLPTSHRYRPMWCHYLLIVIRHTRGWVWWSHRTRSRWKGDRTADWCGCRRCWWSWHSGTGVALLATCAGASGQATTLSLSFPGPCLSCCSGGGGSWSAGSAISSSTIGYWATRSCSGNNNSNYKPGKLYFLTMQTL